TPLQVMAPASATSLDYVDRATRARRYLSRRSARDCAILSRAEVSQLCAYRVPVITSHNNDSMTSEYAVACRNQLSDTSPFGHVVSAIPGPQNSLRVTQRSGAEHVRRSA